MLLQRLGLKFVPIGVLSVSIFPSKEGVCQSVRKRYVFAPRGGCARVSLLVRFWYVFVQRWFSSWYVFATQGFSSWCVFATFRLRKKTGKNWNQYMVWSVFIFCNVYKTPLKSTVCIVFTLGWRIGLSAWFSIEFLLLRSGDALWPLLTHPQIAQWMFGADLPSMQVRMCCWPELAGNYSDFDLSYQIQWRQARSQPLEISAFK